MEINQLQDCRVELLKGFNRVYGLNGYQIPTDKESIYKYLPLKYLKADITKSRITFVSPNTWEDTFETRYYKLKHYNSKLAFLEPTLFCMCLTSKQATNEDAFWRRYATQNDDLIKVHYNIKELFRILEAFATKHNAEIYAGEVIYTDKTSIELITPTKNKIFFPKPFELKHYLSLMSLKRRAFRYENEVRIFVVFNKDNDLNDTIVEYADENKEIEKLLFVEYSNNDEINGCSHIGQVRVSPYPKSASKFPKPDKDTELVKRRNKISKSLKGIKVTRSMLFEPCPKCRL